MERYEALFGLLINDFFDFTDDPNTVLLLYNKAGEADDRLLLRFELYLLRKLFLFLDKALISVNRCLFLLLLLFAPPTPPNPPPPPSYID